MKLNQTLQVFDCNPIVQGDIARRHLFIGQSIYHTLIFQGENENRKTEIHGLKDILVRENEKMGKILTQNCVGRGGATQVVSSTFKILY